MTELSYLTRPGLSYLSSTIIINMITDLFDLEDDSWVQSRTRHTEPKIARQLLMTCLIDHVNYTCERAGFVCRRDHSTAIHSRKVILETLMNDSVYGEKVRRIYRQCKELKKHEKRY